MPKIKEKNRSAETGSSGVVNRQKERSKTSSAHKRRDKAIADSVFLRQWGINEPKYINKVLSIEKRFNEINVLESANERWEEFARLEVVAESDLKDVATTEFIVKEIRSAKVEAFDERRVELDLKVAEIRRKEKLKEALEVSKQKLLKDVKDAKTPEDILTAITDLEYYLQTDGTKEEYDAVKEIISQLKDVAQLEIEAQTEKAKAEKSISPEKMKKRANEAVIETTVGEMGKKDKKAVLVLAKADYGEKEIEGVMVEITEPTEPQIDAGLAAVQRRIHVLVRAGDDPENPSNELQAVSKVAGGIMRMREDSDESEIVQRRHKALELSPDNTMLSFGGSTATGGVGIHTEKLLKLKEMGRGQMPFVQIKPIDSSTTKSSIKYAEDLKSPQGDVFFSPKDFYPGMVFAGYVEGSKRPKGYYWVENVVSRRNRDNEMEHWIEAIKIPRSNVHEAIWIP
jgi:hypothetical protein